MNAHSPHTTLVPFALLLLGAPSLVSAGNLAETARAVDNKSQSSASATTIDRDDDEDSRHSSLWDDEDSSSSSCLSCARNAPIELDLGPPSFDLRLSAQKVRDSDGSFHFDSSMLFGRLGVYASADHYFEHIEAKAKFGEMSEDVRVNLFELAMVGRFLDTDALKGDVRMAFSSAASSHFDTLLGGAMGIKLSARASELVTLTAEARGMAYQHDVTAYEGAAGAQISYGWLGYRALKFDVGPVLEGPEAGLRFQF